MKRTAANILRVALAGALVAGSPLGCGPRALIPPLPAQLPGALGPEDSGAVLARQLAPTLYLHRDETFPLTRVVAILHPVQRVVAYHLLWRDDAIGAWLPFTKPTDEEEIWVGYDSTGAPTDLWTYWHGTILHADWRGKGQILVDVQWGKHGSLPRPIDRATLLPPKTLDSYYVLMWLLIPDMLLGKLNRRGPACFCRSYARYLEFTRPLALADRLDVVARVEEPDPILRAVFGVPYSRKPPWPWLVGRATVPLPP